MLMLLLLSVRARGWGKCHAVLSPGHDVAVTAMSSQQLGSLPKLSKGRVEDPEDPVLLRCYWEWMVSEEGESVSF